MDQPDEHPATERPRWNTDPASDYPVGPDDAGNAVMHGFGLIVSGWNWIVHKVRRSS